jgi:hypothetical protein
MTPHLNPGEEQRRTAFAEGIVELARKHGLDGAEVADSMLTMLIGVFLAEGLTCDVLVKRVRHAWKLCEVFPTPGCSHEA